jgi:branched-chain amino acid transport system substrate-binding protein
VKVGVILPLSGDLAKYGKTSRTAIELANEEINSKAGTNSVRLEIVFEDDALNPSIGVSAAKKLIETDKVVAILGPLASSVTLAVAPSAEKSRVVLLSPGSSAPKLSDAGDYIFRNALSDIYEGTEMAKFAFNTLNLRKVAILYINNDFGIGLRDVFRKEFEELRGAVISIQAFSQGSRDHRAQLSKLIADGPEATYLVGYDEMISIFKQSKELGFRTRWLATTFLNDQDLVTKTGGAADGTVFASWDYSPDSQDPKVKQFAEKIRERTGGLEADVFAANAYDAVYLLYEAIKRKGSTSEQIRDGLYSIQGFEGVTGKTSFDRNGDVIKPIRIKTIVNGKIQPLKK